MNKLTIAIPTYNHEQFLKEALDSALAQTVPADIIVVNDGSTDGTKFILDEYSDRVKVITQINKGLASARNTALMNTETEWFLPLDSDDILEANCVESLLKAIDELGDDADVVAPSFQMFGENNQLVILQMRPKLDDFKQGNRIGYCSAIRTKVLKEVGGYSPRMVWGYEDYALWFNLLRLGKKIYTVPEPLWRYRVRQGSMITTAQQHHDELMRQIAHDNPGVF